MRGSMNFEKIKSSLSLAVILKDDLTPDKSVKGEVFLMATGIKKQPIRHKTGYFLFMDLPKREYQLTAGGRFYKLENYPINMDSINPKEPFVEVFLKQKSIYPFPQGSTVIKGSIINSENKLISDASIKIKETDTETISENDGGFFFYFDTVDEDKNIVFIINKSGYKKKEVKALVKKNAPVQIGIIKLIQK